MTRLNASPLFRQQAHIDGAWIDADSGATFAVGNPANGETIDHVPMMGEAETVRAIRQPIYDRFAERLAEAVKGLRVGPGTQDGVNLGPLIDDSAVAKVESHIGSSNRVWDARGRVTASTSISK